MSTRLPHLAMFWKALVVALIMFEAAMLADSFVFHARAALPLVIVCGPLVMMAFVHLNWRWLVGETLITMMAIAILASGQPAWAGDWGFICLYLTLASPYIVLIIHMALWLTALQKLARQPRVTTKEKMDDWLEQAHTAFNQQDYRQCIECYKQAGEYGELDRLSVYYLNQAKERLSGVQ